MNEQEHRNIALEFFKLVTEGKFKEGLQYFSPNCITHNPYFTGTINNLMDAMVEANKQGMTEFPKAAFTVRQVLADSDYVAVYTQLLNNGSAPSEGGLRQMHLFRFEGDKIVEYWDISQEILPTMPNAAGSF
jgi:predicted SnoaL-like aldol condensation-catalyzing enzyme